MASATSYNKQVAPTPRKRGSGEHRRKTLWGREACRIVSKNGASSGVRTRRRRNFRTLADTGTIEVARRGVLRLALRWNLAWDGYS